MCALSLLGLLDVHLSAQAARPAGEPTKLREREVARYGNLDLVACFPPNLFSSTLLSLSIGSSSGAVGEVAIPGLDFFVLFSVQAGTVVEIPIPQAATLGGGLEELGIGIRAIGEISVTGLNHANTTADGFAVLPVGTEDTEFMAMSYFAFGGQIAVVALHDGTEVTITPSGAETPITVSMSRLQTYLYSFSGGDLTGSSVESNRRIAVFSGNTGAFVGSCSARDHLVEQVPPLGAWGKTILSMQLAEQSGANLYRVLAAEDGTTVEVKKQFSPDVTITLDRGEYAPVSGGGWSTFTADKPILVGQFARGGECAGIGDPFMMFLPPSTGFADAHLFATPDPGYSSHYVNIVARTSVAEAGDVLLNGLPLDPLVFEPIGSTGYSGAQVPLPVGTHAIESTSPVGTTFYGWREWGSYGIPGPVRVGGN